MLSNSRSNPRSNPGSSEGPSLRYGRVTMAMCVVFCVVFLFESYQDGGALMDISPHVLAKLGGNTPIFTLGNGEWWRLVTAALMHAGLIHIAFNVYATLIIASVIEKTLGAGWVLGAFVFSGITGSLLSAYANQPNVVAIGASGGIFGLVAMAAAMSYLAPRLAWFSRALLTQWLVFSLLIGLAAGFDNWGHVGGIVGGVLCAIAAAAFKKNPVQVRWIGTFVGAVGTIVALVCVVIAISRSLGIQPE